MSPSHSSRRSFLASSSALLGAALLDASHPAWAIAALPHLGASPIRLRASMRSLEVNGKSASMMGLELAGGRNGLSLKADRPLDVLLENRLPSPTAIHWHGLHPPNSQDGVPWLTQSPIASGESRHYRFVTKPSGTHWMHSHLGLQEAFLLAAPLIVHQADDEPTDEQQVIVFLGDFSFKSPTEIFDNLRNTSKPAMNMSMGMKMAMPDPNDVDYDAYLANDRTLADPEVVRVEKNARVRLRIINGSSGTNFFVDLGALEGELIATDGIAVKPLRASRFPLAIAQRIDVRVQLPTAGTFPILALREGAIEQTGIVLATSGATIPKLPQQNAVKSGLLTLEMESRLTPAHQPVAKPVDRSFDLELGGNMAKYEWSINGVSLDLRNPRATSPGVTVKAGQRVAIRFVNRTGMSHPMHLHGHSFQVIDFNGVPLQGALRDTVLVPPKSAVTVAFDADNPGTWYVHCHVLWHLAAGMATLVQYES